MNVGKDGVCCGAQVVQANLNELRLPTESANEAEWQAFATNLQVLLVRYRNIGHDLNLTDEQQRRID